MKETNWPYAAASCGHLGGTGRNRNAKSPTLCFAKDGPPGPAHYASQQTRESKRQRGGKGEAIPARIELKRRNMRGRWAAAVGEGPKQRRQSGDWRSQEGGRPGSEP